jgi:hypothetical protein
MFDTLASRDAKGVWSRVVPTRTQMATDWHGDQRRVLALVHSSERREVA